MSHKEDFLVITRAYYDPLRRVPGPRLCRFTPLYDWYKSWLGYECRWIEGLHQKYGPVVRIAPNEVVISEGEALAPIYTEKGGFFKSPAYVNFDSEGHPTIFSGLDSAHRALRAKAVMPLFSTGSLRNGTAALETCICGMIGRLEDQAEKSRGAANKTGGLAFVDVLNLSRRLAIDSLCAYLFGKDYGGIRENGTKLSASMFVDSIGDFGRFFFLPNWIFLLILNFNLKYFPDAAADKSAAKVDAFTGELVEKAEASDGTYQSRLLHAGISAQETDVQLKDVIFAGTDGLGTNFGALLWQLAKHPEVYKKLRAEVLDAEQQDPNYDVRELRYLDCVIKEGLRMALANPTRFPRQVPPTGFSYTSPSSKRTYYLPPGTLVGLQPRTLHFNPAVFHDPWTFKPERWLDPSHEMLRDWIPFGLGPRQCIARNLATYELLLTTRAVARSGVLEGAKCVQDRLDMVEWFNAKVRGDKIELVWT
ncbi:hypothetical protein DOTSEDRAFT_91733 [Dothistroma septosporum NZE10]|uniref:Uncharacterized protein n=1 Tax=Dothistroma septosporum (strain NZE10 / CBS 128990) TaxID=675120 RepID=M2YKG6_DOTSN|nr:hypothetical protein DOTSEDRAFT_91733 [Dothistroma septosporum NZE10]